jgi:hypothetical protein
MAEYFYDMLEITNLIFSIDNTVSQHRASYDEMRQTDLILSVPIFNAFGDTVTYFDTGQRVATYNVNLNLTSLNVKIRDQQGRLVDFRGSPWTAQVLLQFYDNSDSTNENAGDLNAHKANFPNFDKLQTALPYSFQNDVLFPTRANNYVSKPITSINPNKRKMF